MKRLSLSLILLFVFISSFAVDIRESARMSYVDSMKALGQGNTDKALLDYEKALFDDSRILAFDDKGLLNSLTLKYLKLQNEDSKDEYLFKLGLLFRLSGNYNEAVNFFNKLIKDFPDSNYKERAGIQVYEMTVMNEQLKIQQNTGQTQEVTFVSDEEGQKEKISEEEKKNAEEQRKNELAQKYSEDVSKIENEISQLKNDHDLWFSLEYGKHNQPKENYYEAMVYYYEKKIKQAEKKLKDLQEKLGKLK